MQQTKETRVELAELAFDPKSNIQELRSKPAIRVTIMEHRVNANGTRVWHSKTAYPRRPIVIEIWNVTDHVTRKTIPGFTSVRLNPV